jgi:hypothetical protein
LVLRFFSLLWGGGVLSAAGTTGRDGAAAADAVIEEEQMAIPSAAEASEKGLEGARAQRRKPS